MSAIPPETRVLIGPQWHFLGPWISGDRPVAFDVRYFDAPPPGEPFSHVLEALPAGWIPDVVLWLSPERELIPPGLEDCPHPTFLVSVDWNIFPTYLHELPAYFDHVLCDPLQRQVLEREGVGNAVTSLHYGSFDPDGIYDGTPKTIDVSHLRYPLYIDRDQVLAEVTRLAPRFQVFIGGSLPKRVVNDVCKRSKVVVDLTTKREIPVRIYEALGARALYMCEEQNLQVRDRFQEGVHFVTYRDADDLRRKLVRYLEDDAAREEIATAGHAHVRQFAFPEPLEGYVADALQTLRARGLTRRVAASYSATRRLEDLALFNYYRGNTAHDRLARVEVARAALERLRSDGESTPRLENARGAADLAIALQLGGGPARQQRLARAAEALEAARSLGPEYAAPRVNLAELRLLQGELPAAEACALEALERLPEGASHHERDFVIYMFSTEHESNAVLFHHLKERGSVTAARAGYAQYLRSKVLQVLGLVHERRGEWPAALARCEQAADVAPPMDRSLPGRLVALCRRQGDLEGAIRWAAEDIRRSNPLVVPRWLLLAELLFEAGRASECLAACEDSLGRLEALPRERDLHRSAFLALRDRAGGGGRGPLTGAPLGRPLRPR